MILPVTLFDGARDDVGELARLHAASFAAAWSPAWDEAALAALLAAPGHFAFYHMDGFVLARAAGGEAEILTLAVMPSARRQGLGRALMLAAMAHAGQAGAGVLFLEVGVENRAALALYAGLGFAQAGLRKGYYAAPGALEKPGDALVLRLSLAGDFA